MKRKNGLILGIALVALAGVLIWAFRPQPIRVEVAEVRTGLFERVVEDDGKTRVRDRYVVSAPLSGRLARVQLKAGDSVKAGTVVAVLWPSAPAMIDARSHRELNERVGAANAAVEQARANVAREEAALEKARIDLTRLKKLQGEGFLSPSALDQAELAVRVQSKSLEAARFALDGATHDVAQARAALMRAQEGGAVRRPESSWPITSPVDGRVLRVLQESEAAVAIGTPLVEVANAEDLEIVVDVLSTEATQIAADALVRIDAGSGRVLPGRVRRVEPAAFTKVSALGVEEQRVNVIIDFDGAPVSWQRARRWLSRRRAHRSSVAPRRHRHTRGGAVPPRRSLGHLCARGRSGQSEDREAGRTQCPGSLGRRGAGPGRARRRLPERQPAGRQSDPGCTRRLSAHAGQAALIRASVVCLRRSGRSRRTDV